MEKQIKLLNNITAKFLVTRDAAIFLTAALKSARNRMDTIREMNPEIYLEEDIAAINYVLDKYGVSDRVLMPDKNYKIDIRDKYDN